MKKELSELQMSLAVTSNSGVRFELRDEKSTVVFVRGVIPPEEFCSMLAGVHGVPIKAELMDLEKVNKTMESDTLKFVMPKHSYINRHDIAEAEAERVCPAGWEVQRYFNSKTSFFSDEDGKRYAKCEIRRWV
jgi:hypothetical protein